MWFHDVFRAKTSDCELQAKAFSAAFRTINHILLTLVGGDAQIRVFLSAREAEELLAQLAQAIRDLQTNHTHGGNDAHHALAPVER